MNLISTKKVQPSGPHGARLLFIGEAPGSDEDTVGLPFQGDAGDLFNNLLGSINLTRDQVRVTNVCNFRPVNNKFDVLIDTPQLSEGIREIFEYVSEVKPEWVVLMGRIPLEYIGKKYGIENWRGSVIERDGTKFFATLHPASVLYNGPLYSLISFDFQRLERYVREGYKRPYHNFTFDPKGIELEECLQEIETCKRVTVDLEGVKGTTHIRCAGFGLSKSRAICIVNHHYGMDLVFYQSIRRILENPNIEKVFQNGFGYDVPVLKLNDIIVEGYVFDTMIAAHVLEPEMPYGLGFLTSIYTDEPYYKDKGKSAIPDDEEKAWSDKVENEVLWDYNCCDCITDFEIAEKQELELTKRRLWDTYNYKHSLIPLSYTLSETGMLIDEERRQFLKALVKEKRIYYQELLNAVAGFRVNVKSTPDGKKLFLEKYKLPERRNPRTKQITLDEDAIVYYLNIVQEKINSLKTPSVIEEWEYKLVACKCVLLIRGYRQLESNYLNIEISADGRARSVYNFSAATETGRGSCHKYFDGSGNNAQTWPRERIEVSEEDYKRIMEKVCQTQQAG